MLPLSPHTAWPLHHVSIIVEVLVRLLVIFFYWLQAVRIVMSLRPHQELLCFSSTRTVKMLQLL